VPPGFNYRKGGADNRVGVFRPKKIGASQTGIVRQNGPIV
jgi:hypothetical protein